MLKNQNEFYSGKVELTAFRKSVKNLHALIYIFSYKKPYSWYFVITFGMNFATHLNIT
jgi:hypothetical protein